MLRKEWSLIANSLFVQLAAGIFIFLGLFRMITADSADSEFIIRFTDAGMAMTGPLLVLGMISSLFHLGNPFRAYRAVSNLGSSWLSREIFFTGIFFIFWLGYFVMEKYGISTPAAIWATMLAGIMCVISMAGIYYSTGRPGWHSINTYTGFLGSIVVLGSISINVLVVIFHGTNSSITGLSNISILLLFSLLVLKLIQQLMMIFRLKPAAEALSMDTLVAGSVLKSNLAAMFKMLTIWGAVISLLGAFMALCISGMGYPGSAAPFIITSSVIVLAGEILGRAGFYILGIEQEEKKKQHGFGRDVYGRCIKQ